MSSKKRHYESEDEEEDGRISSGNSEEEGEIDDGHKSRKNKKSKKSKKHKKDKRHKSKKKRKRSESPEKAESTDREGGSTPEIEAGEVLEISEEEDKSKLIPKSTLDIAHAIKSCEAKSCGQVLNPNEKHRFVLNTKTNELREVDKDAK